MENFKLFKEEIQPTSGLKLLAQRYIDNGSHPDHFKGGNIKNEVVFEYKRRQIIELTNKINNINQPTMSRLKHSLNIRTKHKKDIILSLDSFNYKKLDKIQHFLLHMSKDSLNIKNTKSKTSKIRSKMGPNRLTRKRSK